MNIISPRNAAHRRPRLQRLRHDPRLHIIRPATTTARTGSTSTLLRVSVETSIVKLTSCSHRSGEISNQKLNWKVPPSPRLPYVSRISIASAATGVMLPFSGDGW